MPGDVDLLHQLAGQRRAVGQGLRRGGRGHGGQADPGRGREQRDRGSECRLGGRHEGSSLTMLGLRRAICPDLDRRVRRGTPLSRCHALVKTRTRTVIHTRLPSGHARDHDPRARRSGGPRAGPSSPIRGPAPVRSCWTWPPPAVNRADLLQRKGKYPPPPGVSEVPGLECSGTVAALGEGVAGVRGGRRGVRVARRRRLRGEGRGAGRASCCPCRAGWTWSTAASLPEVACTVWSNVVMTAGLVAGETLLVHGGAGGIGTHAIQVGKALGARVAVTAGSAERLARCAELGADVLINYHEQDFVEEVRAATEGRGADVILDNMGAKYLPRNVDALARNGRLVVIGMQGGIKGELNLGQAAGQVRLGDGDDAAVPAGRRRRPRSSRRWRRSCGRSSRRAAWARSCTRCCRSTRLPTPTGCWRRAARSSASCSCACPDQPAHDPREPPKITAPWMAAPALSGGTPLTPVYRSGPTKPVFVGLLWIAGPVVDRSARRAQAGDGRHEGVDLRGRRVVRQPDADRAADLADARAPRTRRSARRRRTRRCRGPPGARSRPTP